MIISVLVSFPSSMNRTLLLAALAAFALAFSREGSAQTITATQSDTFAPNAASRATPGNTISYEIEINSTGGVAATGVTLTNATPANTTLVPGSLRTTCVAINDAYAALGNVSITVPAGSGVLANDLDPDNTGPSLTATPIVAGATSQGGTVTLSSDGGFTYDPPAGYNGDDTFSYTLNDNDGEGNTDTATVTITVSGMIWFIDENAAATGDGRLSNPFSTLAAFQGLNNNIGNNPGDGDSIFLYESAQDYTGGVTLREGQRLIGQDATTGLAALAGVTVPAFSASLPSMNSGVGSIARIVNTGGNGVALGVNSRVHGVTLGNASGTALVASSAGTIQVSDVIVNTTGAGISISSTVVGTGSGFTSVNSTGGVNGISLVSVTGDIPFGSGALSAHSGNAFNVSGGSGNLSYSGSITRTSATGSAVNIVNRTGTGTVNLSGAISATNANGVTMTGNSSGTTVNIAGGVTVSSGANPAFIATGGGTINVTGSSNTLATSTGTALNVANTTIGSSGLNFRSISANGAVSGIILNNTGTTAGLTVTGTGAADTGGVIQNTSGSGISATSTMNLSLTAMRFTNCSDAIDGSEAAIRATGLTGTCALTNCVFAGSSEDHVRITNSSGTLTALNVTGSTFNANSAATGGHGLSVINTGTSVATVNVSTTDFTGIRSSSLLMNVTDTATGNLNVTGGTHTDIGAAVTVQSAASADLGFNVNGITSIRAISNAIQLVAGSTSTPSSNIVGIVVNNNIGNGSVDSGSRDSYGIALDLRGDQDSILSVVGNSIRNTDINGIFISSADFGTLVGPGARMDLRLRDNTVSNIDDNSAFPFFSVYGVLVDVRHTTTAYLDVANNLSSSVGGLEHFRFRQRDTAQVFVERLSDGDATPGELINSVGLLEIFFAGQNGVGSTADVTIATGMIEAADGAGRDPLLFGSATAMESPVISPEKAEQAAAARIDHRDEIPIAAEITPVSAESDRLLDQGQLDSLVAEAKRRWHTAGIDEDQKRLLDAVRFELAELPGMWLGEASHQLVRIDRDAAGNGWFVDPTPDDDREFDASALNTAAANLHSNRVDLLTTVMHELGHALGLSDDYSAESRRRIMHGWLHLGERRLPRVGEAVGIKPAGERVPEYLSAPLNIGTLPAGKSITVTFEATINTTPVTFTTVSSQGTVSGSNFANVLTNDPDTVAAADATVTPVEQAPTITNITANGSEDTQLNFAAAQFTGAFSDANGDSLSLVRITSLPANGVLNLNATPVSVNDEVPAASLANLNFIPAANFNGATSFGYNASDGQAYAATAATVNINIVSINDQPTLTAIPNPSAILEDAGEQTVNLAGISEGAANETSQTLTITATSDNVALIPNPVTVDYTEGAATGVIRYTPEANAFGTAVITVRVQDSGGTANGGVDTLERTFTVVVDPVADTPSITNATTLPNTQTASGLVVSRNAADGAEVTHYQITNIQSGTLFQNDGTTAIPANSFITHAQAGAGLKFTPAANFQGDATFQVQASTSNLVGGLGGDVITATISVSERVSIDTTNPGDNDAEEGGMNNGLFTFTRGGSAGELVANFQLNASSSATASDFSLTVVGSGAVSFNSGAGTGTVTFPDTVTTVQVRVTAIAEALNSAEAAETLRFDIVTSPGVYLAGTPDNATVTIAQNGFLVTTTNDSGEGSLRQAVANANAIAGTDTITFSDGTGGTVNFTDATLDTITLTSGQLTLSSDMQIEGTAANQIAVSGNGSSRVFQVDPGNTVRLSGLNITSGGGVTRGAGIRNRGTLLLLSCAITNNTASGTNSAGGGLSSGDVFEAGALTTVVNSIFSGNSAGIGGGSVTTSGNSLTIINCTFSDNAATPSSGGAIFSDGTTSVFNTTITGNTAASRGGGVYAGANTFTLANSIVAHNTAGDGQPDVIKNSAGILTSSGGNLIGNGEDTFNLVTWAGTDLTGTSASPLNPLLGPLANSGGPTSTHALLAGSPALNAGLPANVPADTLDLDGDTNSVEPIPFDQRGSGFTRSIGSVDIGAFELQKSVTISPLLSTQAEGSGGGTTNFTFTVARTGDFADAVTLDWTVTGSGVTPANAADFAAMSGQVTLNATEESKVINVTVNADTIVEPNEGFTVTLSNPTNGYVLTTATADGTINNDDSSTLTLTGGVSTPEGNTGSTNVVYIATLSNAVQGGFSVAYTTSDDTATAADGDYTDNDGSLSFTGNAGETRTITVAVNGDTKVEAGETFVVALGLVTGSPGTVTIVDSSTPTTITNDDSATISITDVTQLESSGSQVFTVSLSNPVDIAVSVDIATADGTALTPADYGSNSGTITFPAGNNNSQTVTVTVVNDSEFEADETFVVNLSNLVAAARSVTISDSQGLGTIQNDDALTISITATNDSADENSAGTGTWRISRNGTLGAVTANLEVDLTSTALAADWTQSGASFVSMAPGGIGTVTIPDGQSFVDITLTPVDDLAAEADETVQLNLTAGSGYTASNGLTRTVTIARNDFGVTKVDDSGEGSLRQAVDNANVLAGNPTITFVGPVFTDATPDTIVLTTGQIDVSTPVTIAGTGAKLLTISGNDASRIFLVLVTGEVIMSGLHLTDGNGDTIGGGAVFCQGGTLLLEGCVVAGNRSVGFGGGLALVSSSIVTIRDCTISDNRDLGTGFSAGGILHSAISLTIVNSTVSNNQNENSTAQVAAGGILCASETYIENSTIVGNSAVNGGPAGGVLFLATATMRNSIVSGNASGANPSDIQSFDTLTATHNLIGDAATSGGITDGTNGNLVGNAGTGTIDIATVLDTTLADNGGLTPTHKLIVGSPAIDAGDPVFDGSTFTPALTNDQRGAGFVRVTKGLAASSAARIDIGAYELIEAPVFTDDDLEINTGSMPLDLSTASGVTPAGGTFTGTGVSGGFFDPTGLALGAYTVTYTVTDGSGNANSTNLSVTVTEIPSLTVTSTSDTISKIDGQTSLREALAYAATLTGAQTVDFSDTTTGGSVNFHDAVPDTILLGGTELEVIGNVTIDGPGADLLKIDGNAASRVFLLSGVDPAIEITFRSLTVANGASTTGAGVRVRDGILNVENCAFEDNVATDNGGAIDSDAVTLNLIDSVFLNNEAEEGGAASIDSDGAGRRCHFEGNRSVEDGGAVSFSATSFVFSESTFIANEATDEGGAIDNNGNDLLLVNCTLSGNTAGTAGGGINNQDGLTLVNCTVVGNRADADGVEQSVGTPDEGFGGGGIRTDDDRGIVTLFNTIVAGNRRGAPGSDVAADLSTALPADTGVDPASANNLIGDPGFVGELVHGVNGNIIGKEDGAGPRIEWPLAEILNPVLADNGGLSLTHSLVIGSPAIDSGDNALAVDEASAPLLTDQRGTGFGRFAKGLALSSGAIVDMGAYELFAAPVFNEDDLSISVDAAPLDLAQATGVSPAGGTFSGPGVSGGFFDPRTQSPGVYTLTYTATDAFGVSNSADFTVTVEALPPSLTVTPPKRFKTTLVGSRSRTQRVFIRNVGGLPTSTLRVAVSGPAKKDFIVTQPEARSLGAGESTFFQATFRPRKTGNRKATVTVYSDSSPVNVALKGRGKKSSGLRPPRAVRR